MSDRAPNPQINVSKIPGGAGIAGAVFALGSMLIFLVGIPRFRYFFIAAVILGCGIALILRFVHRETPGKPWILSATQHSGSTTPPVQAAPSTNRPEDLRPKLQALAPTSLVIRGAILGSVANSESREAMACVPGESYAAMPKIVWMNRRCATGSPLATQRT